MVLRREKELKRSIGRGEGGLADGSSRVALGSQGWGLDDEANRRWLALQAAEEDQSWSSFCTDSAAHR